ncbi:MAG TPA: DedA family protein [Cytophagaceae bacterium]
MSESILEWGGITILIILTYLETGLFLGLLIPGGETMVFTAGLLIGAESLQTSVAILIPGLILAGLAGDFTGYYLGKKFGKKLYQKKDTWYFKKKYLKRTETYYCNHEIIGIVAGKFIPFLRPFTPLVCGIIGVDLKKFFLLSFIAVILYVNLFLFMGYYLVQLFPFIKDYISYIIPIIIFIALIPFIITIIKEKRKERHH